MSNKTNDIFVKIQKVRYRLNSIKRYEPFETNSAKIDKFGVYIYFSMTGNQSKTYHYYATEEERDYLMAKLDELFNITY
jgi:hypothetical protein